MQWLSSLGPVGEVLRVVILVIEVLLVFNLMILVHEWGHFLAARWRGLKVEAFYIWFGKPLWKKTINGVEYGLGSIPAGGFVKLPQMAPMDAIEGGSASDEPLPPITPLDKAIVAFAGPLFSFGLAVLFAFLVMAFGKPESEHVITTTIGYVDEGSPAEKAGLKPGDTIKTIDGHAIRKFEGFVDSVRWAVISSEGDNIRFQVERPGHSGLLEIPVPAKELKNDKKKLAWWEHIFKRPELRDIGINGKHTPMIGELQPHGPADDAGLKPNDEILSVDGIPILSREQVADYLDKKAPKTFIAAMPFPIWLRPASFGMPLEAIELLVRRNGKEFPVKLTPRIPDLIPADAPELNRPMIGIVWHAKGRQTPTNPPVLSQISDASRSMFNMISKLIAAKSDISPAHMSGPVGIGRVYYNLLQDPNAILLVLWFSVVLNINLAIMNMLPFPVLDGGHITLAAMEAIRRRPIHSRFLEILQTVCALGLFGFLIFVTLKDFGDIFGGGKKRAEVKLFLPKDQRPAPIAPV
ncbi:MAG TPA: site-2 protease family protein, partial [Prosthecobacter sp.]|nr:site-2 protease family protein [Prosthecobacter sp.]